MHIMSVCHACHSLGRALLEQQLPFTVEHETVHRPVFDALSMDHVSSLLTNHVVLVINDVKELLVFVSCSLTTTFIKYLALDTKGVQPFQIFRQIDDMNIVTLVSCT